MNGATYYKEKLRMTKDCTINCEECNLSSLKNGMNISCYCLEIERIEKAFEIVEKWSKENPERLSRN